MNINVLTFEIKIDMEVATSVLASAIFVGEDIFTSYSPLLCVPTFRDTSTPIPPSPVKKNNLSTPVWGGVRAMNPPYNLWPAKLSCSPNSKTRNSLQKKLMLHNDECGIFQNKH